MDLSSRIKAASIENRNCSKLIKQMFLERSKNSKVKFSFKNEIFENYEGDLLKASPNNSMNNHSFDLNNDFNIVTNDTELDNLNVIEDEAFVKEIRFFKVEESLDTVTLSGKLLSEENLFKEKINYFSDGKVFHNNTK